MKLVSSIWEMYSYIVFLHSIYSILLFELKDDQHAVVENFFWLPNRKLKLWTRS